jgi:hypothetical protein
VAYIRVGRPTRLLFDSEDESSRFLLNVCEPLPDYMATHPRIWHQAERCLFHMSCWLFSLLFDPEDGGSIFLRNVGKPLPEYKSSHSHKIVFFIVTAVMTSNPIQLFSIRTKLQQNCHLLISWIVTFLMIPTFK